MPTVSGSHSTVSVARAVKPCAMSTAATLGPDVHHLRLDDTVKGWFDEARNLRRQDLLRLALFPLLTLESATGATAQAISIPPRGAEVLADDPVVDAFVLAGAEDAAQVGANLLLGEWLAGSAPSVVR